MGPKHRNDYNHGKHGWIGGNPRFGKTRGNFKGKRQGAHRQALRIVRSALADMRAEREENEK